MDSTIMTSFFKKILSLRLFNLSLFEIAVIVGLFYYLFFINPLSLFQLVPLAIAVVLHELAHAYVAFRFGDPTAQQQGRLTLNPLAHIDPLGTVILPLLLLFSGSGFLIAWAKPVPVDSQYFKNPLKDMMWVAIAGPLTNLSIAFFCSILLKSMSLLSLSSFLYLPIVIYVLKYSIFINLVLALFNLFPIPPLDGSRILAYFSPDTLRNLLFKLEPYGLLIVFFLAYLDIFSIVLSYAIPPLMNVLL